MSHKAFLTIAVIISTSFSLSAQTQTDYMPYHQDIIYAEELIVNEKYSDALLQFDRVFNSYEYIFLRDYKVAAQLALFINDETRAFNYLRSGISAGWTWKDITSNKFLKPLTKNNQWEIIKSQYETLRSTYVKRINPTLRAEVRDMFKKDQRIDFPYYLRIGQKARERYALRKFAPNNETQLERLNEILDTYGYPGEKLIGNSVWMSTILIHHNSISTEYAQKDKLYPALKPRLLNEIRNGGISPGDFALIDDWYVAVKSNREESAYGYLTAVPEQELQKSDDLRRRIGLRSIETRNSLADIQEKTGMKFYLDGAPWVNDKINVVNRK